MAAVADKHFLPFHRGIYLTDPSTAWSKEVRLENKSKSYFLLSGSIVECRKCIVEKLPDVVKHLYCYNIMLHF